MAGRRDCEGLAARLFFLLFGPKKVRAVDKLKGLRIEPFARPVKHRALARDAVALPFRLVPFAFVLVRLCVYTPFAQGRLTAPHGEDGRAVRVEILPVGAALPVANRSFSCEGFFDLSRRQRNGIGEGRRREEGEGDGRAQH